MRVAGKPCSAGRPANAPHTPQNAVVTSAKIRPARRVMPDTGTRATVPRRRCRLAIGSLISPCESKENESQLSRLIFRFILFTISKSFVSVKTSTRPNAKNQLDVAQELESPRECLARLPLVIRSGVPEG